MKILNVNMILDPSGGGTVERTFQMSRTLAKAGVECIVLTTDLGLTPERIKALEGVKVIALPCVVKRFYVPTFSYALIKNTVENADIIHLMNHWTLLNALVYFIARRLNKPYVICPAGTLLPTHYRSRFLKRLYNWFVGGKMLRNANGYIAITPGEIPQFRAYGIEEKKISVIPNAINAEDFLSSDTVHFKRKYNLGDHPLIMFVGRLSYIKGPDLLLRAFCHVQDKLQHYHLVFVGPDEGMLTELQKTVAEFKVSDRVHFIGYVEGVDKSQAYHAADLLVIPSRHEAMSIVALEAGITGTPVMLTDQCGFNEVADVGGGLVVSTSVNELQTGLIDILRDPVELQSKGTNLKKYTYEHFTWDSLVDKYLKLYQEILDAKIL